MPRSCKPARPALLAAAITIIGLLGMPVLAVGSAHAAVGGRYVTTWTGPVANLCVYGAVDVAINWGDGTTQQVTGTRVPGSAGPVSHTFNQAAPTHQVTVTGSFPRLGCSDVNDAVAGLVSVDEWGETGTTDLSSAFYGTHDLQAVAEPPSTVTDMSEMFLVSSFNGPIGGWDTTGVTDMSRMFNTSEFNQPIGGWDTSTVTRMAGMFGSSLFNQPLGSWDVGNVVDLSWMFDSSPFNRPVGNWDTSSVTNMKGVFANSPFNQPVGNWDTSSVTDMGAVFNDTPFNQPIGGWNTSSVTNLTVMFRNTPFDQPIGAWGTSRATTMSGMFQGSSFNQPIGAWDTSQVTDMSWMFQGSSFNQPIGAWDTSQVTDMSWMLESTPFDQPIGDWDTARVTEMDDMFHNSESFDQPLGAWDTAEVVDMDGMFYGAASFDQDLSSWCVTNFLEEPIGFDTGANSWTLPRPLWGTCGGVDVTGPAVHITSATSTDQVRVRGTATDPSGVARVFGAIQDRATGKWLRRDRTWGAYQRLPANLPDAGATTSRWLLARRLPSGSYTIKIIAFDSLNHINPRPRPFRIVNVN